MAHDILGDIIGDSAGWLALFLQLVGQGKKPADAAKEVTAQRLPNMFGIGRADEQLYESIRQLVSADKRHFVDLVTGAMHDYEENIFRLTLAGMPYGNELADKSVTDSKGKTATSKEVKSWEFTEKDLRVKYLTDIADEVIKAATTLGEQAAVTRVVTDMRARRLITRSPAAQKAYELWVDTTAWIKMEILDFFGVGNFDEITPDMVAGCIDTLAQQVPNRPIADMNLGFWRSAFRRHWFLAGVLVLGIIFLAWKFYAIALITTQ